MPSNNTHPHADLVIRGGRFWLPEPSPQTHAIAIRRGIIDAVGTHADITPWIGPATRIIDASDSHVIPGLHDCHTHLLWTGKLLITQADLTGVDSIDELIARLAETSRNAPGKPPHWIVGFGWDQDKLRERRMPTRADLDRAFPDRPALASRVCGHAAVVNSAALRLVSEEARQAGDAETGLYTETAISPFYRAVPAPDDHTLERALLAAMQVALRSGITSVQTMLDTPEQLRVFHRLRQRLGKLPVRIVGMPMEKQADTLHAQGFGTGFGDDWLSLGAVKFFADGSLGARTALLSAPYADDPSTNGQRIYDTQTLCDRVRHCASLGFAIACHAIGDAALDETLHAIEHAIIAQADSKLITDRARIHRVEHASLTRPDQVDRLARSGIRVAIQPQFVTSDTWTGKRVGADRLHWCYPFASLMRAGVRVGLSSDSPVERIDAAACLRAAVGRHPWAPHDAMTLDEAVLAYTHGSAALAGIDDRVGSLRPGMLADIAIFKDRSKEPNRIIPFDDRPTHVIVAGEVVDHT